MDIDEAVTLYTYDCWDGVTRTRCREHVELRNRRAPVPWKPLVKQELKARRSCVMCFATWVRQAGMAPALAPPRE